MRAVVQRVASASVRVDGETIAAIGPGMLVLLGVVRGDGAEESRALASRIARCRFFADEAGKMNRSALDAGAEVLVVSQFTLAADLASGRRPSFDAAAPPAAAEAFYLAFVGALRELGLAVQTGRFGARMLVELAGDGPVTFTFEQPAGPSQVLA